MSYLADSHTLLWILNDSGRLPPNVKSIFLDPENQISASIASLWELGIKFALGQLPLKTDILCVEQELVDLGVSILPITTKEIHEATLLPMHHRDPFDRIIAATALTTGDTLLSADTVFDQYGLIRVWD